MNNKFYIHSGLMDEQNVAVCLNKAIELCKINNIGNIKLVLNNSSIINHSDNFICNFIIKKENKDKDDVHRLLSKYNSYRFLPEKIGVRILNQKNFNLTKNNETIILIIYANPAIMENLIQRIIGYNNDVVLCLPNELEETKNEINIILNQHSINKSNVTIF